MIEIQDLTDFTLKRIFHISCHSTFNLKADFQIFLSLPCSTLSGFPWHHEL